MCPGYQMRQALLPILQFLTGEGGEHDTVSLLLAVGRISSTSHSLCGIGSMNCNHSFRCEYAFINVELIFTEMGTLQQVKSRTTI
jgi:hypothetical protein